MLRRRRIRSRRRRVRWWGRRRMWVFLIQFSIGRCQSSRSDIIRMTNSTTQNARLCLVFRTTHSCEQPNPPPKGNTISSPLQSQPSQPKKSSTPTTPTNKPNNKPANAAHLKLWTSVKCIHKRGVGSWWWERIIIVIWMRIRRY